MNVVDSFKKIGILTCRGMEEYKEQDRDLINSLTKQGYKAERVIWDQPQVNWLDYEVIVVSTTWDYFTNAENLNRFLATLRKIHEFGVLLFNSLKTIEWNCKKTYLNEVAEKGFPIIETKVLHKSQLDNLYNVLQTQKWFQAVIKPVLSAGARHTERFTIGQTAQIVRRCKTLDVDEWMVQPFAEEIIKDGEYSFIYVGKQFSHCVLKKPIQGDFRTGATNTHLNSHYAPSSEMLEQAQKIMNIFGSQNLCTRLDVIRKKNDLVVMEIEMIEPYLYPKLTQNFGDKLAQALIAKIMETKKNHNP